MVYREIEREGVREGGREEGERSSPPSPPPRKERKQTESRGILNTPNQNQRLLANKEEQTKEEGKKP